MSSEIYKSYETFSVRSDIQFVVNKTQIEVLADFVRDTIRDKDLSYRKVAAASGGLITHSTVSDVVNKRGSPTVISLQGIARGLNISEEYIFAIARGKTPNIERISNERFNELAVGYSRLSIQHRQNIEPLIAALDVSIKNYMSEYRAEDKPIQQVTKEGPPIMTIEEFERRRRERNSKNED